MNSAYPVLNLPSERKRPAKGIINPLHQLGRR